MNYLKIKLMKKKYKKIVELPTGVTTKISDTLTGKIEVIYEIVEPFNKKL